MPAIIIYASLAMLAGIFLARLIHGRGRVSIVVEPGSEQWDAVNPTSPPLISVIIPARNEARNIHACLQALSAQTYPNFELIVVDDCSDDATPSILAELATQEPRLRVVSGEELPEGWAGKPHALVQGTALAGGEWLCFMDADTFASPQLLRSTYAAARQQQADMFTIFTRQDLGSFWERVVLPLVFLGLAYGFPAERVNDPASPVAIANGQFILIRRSVYDQIGGHTAVRDHIDDDRALAAVVKQAGLRLVLADGRQVAHTRMYTSLSEMWEGWTKNIYLGLRDRRGLLLFGAMVGLLVTFVLPVWLTGGMVWVAEGGGWVAGVVLAEGLVLWAYLLWKRWLGSRYFGLQGWYAFTFPLGALLFFLMMLASTYDVLSGRGVRWKGRKYR